MRWTLGWARGRRLIVALGIVAAVITITVVVAGTTGPEARTLPPPSSTSSTDPTAATSIPDFSQVALEPVPGETTTTLLATGSSTLRGIVQGPDGPVVGATVRADRLVGTGTQRLEAFTMPDGTFSMVGIPGGRFRVRAFLPPTLVMADAEVFFLVDGDERELRLVIEPYTGISVRSDTSPGAPIVGQEVNLVVRVADRTVDEDGIAVEVPRANTPIRVSTSGWTSLNDDDGFPTVTGDNGLVLFRFRCDRVTSVSGFAVVGEQQETFPLDLPPCAPVPTTTTTTTTTTTVPDEDDDDDGTTSTSGG